MEIVQRAPGARGFAPISKRWAAEWTYGWLVLHRGVARYYETFPACSEAMIHLAMSALMARRLAGDSTISWHDQTPQDQTPVRDEATGENDL